MEIETEKSVLSDACGHHCGIKDKKVGHCPCVECHGRKSPKVLKMPR